MKRPDGVVYVVAKAPQPGVSKTRLCPPLTPDQASQLARAFLHDTLANATLAGVTPRIVCRTASEQHELRRLVGALTQVSMQSGAGLGDALVSAFRDGLADGFTAVAVLGADTPTLPVLVIREAFAALTNGADVALGPAEDGGYYLLAARGVHPSLFHDMPWSTSGWPARLCVAVEHWASARMCCPPGTTSTTRRRWQFCGWTSADCP